MLRRPALAHVTVFVTVFVGLLLAGREKLLRDPGTFWHVLVGRRILAGSGLPTADWLTYSHAGQPWIAQQWLGEIVMAALDRVGGLDALAMASAAVLALLFAQAFWRLRDRGLPTIVSAWLVALACAASAYHFHARPHLASLVFLAWLQGLLVDIDAGRASRRAPWAIPAVMVVWTNIHGGVLVGIAMVALWAGARLGIGLFARRQPQTVASTRGPRPAALGLLLLACLLAPLVNPYGLRMLETWSYLATSPLLPKVIDEHAPLALASPEGAVVLVLAIVYVLALLGAQSGRRGPSAFLPLVLLVLGFARVRNAPLFAVAVPAVLAELLPGSRWAAFFARRGSDLLPLVPPERPWRPPPVVRLVPALIAAGALALQAARLPVPLLGSGWARLEPGWWPVGVVEPLAVALRELHTDRVFNSMRFGGFIPYFAPGARGYIDDRCELVRDQGLRDFVATMADPTRLGPRLDNDGVSVALVEPGSTFDRWFADAPGWRPRATDSAANLYVRRPRAP